MSNFADMLTADAPRLVVKCHKKPNGDENFEWGLCGNGKMPILSLIGYVQRIEADMIAQLAERRNECPETAFVIAWCADTNLFDWWIHRDIPVDPLIGMLEAIKMGLLLSMNVTGQARPAHAKRLLGPDGNPFNLR